jgi:hypothetical protein
VCTAFTRGKAIDLRTGDPVADDPATSALWGPDRVVRATVLASLLLGGQPAVPGCVPVLEIWGARVDGELVLDYSEIPYRVRLVGCDFPERISLFISHTRQITMRGCRLVRFYAANTTIDGNLRLIGCRINGLLMLDGAHIIGSVKLDGTHLERPDEVALSADRIEIGDHLSMCATDQDLAEGIEAQPFKCNGAVVLKGARIGGDLTIRDGSFSHPPGTALDLRFAQARELYLQTADAVNGVVDLRYATARVLHDDQRIAPAQLRLDGLRYDRLEPPMPVLHRIKRIEQHTHFYLPQPFEQLALAYRSLGQDAEARTVLLAKERCLRKTLPWYRSVWGLVQDLTVGYGYRPVQAAIWLFAFLTFGSVVFATHRPTRTSSAGTTTFNPVIFTLDHLFPVIAFGQSTAFAPTPGTQWIGYVLTAAGWILTTTIVTGVTRAVFRP